MNVHKLRFNEKYNKTNLHAIAPYVGKMRPELAHCLINEYSEIEDIIFDPFCGSGTVALEAWINKRKAIATDLNYYAFLITKAKLNPYVSIERALQKLDKYNGIIKSFELSVNLESVPDWVNEFFHPETLKEILSWVQLLKENNEWFFLACLMGILHHQRPGFLSYPSSHGAPYLRIKKFPQDQFPGMYEYRNVYERMLKKVKRSYIHYPDLDYTKQREVFHCDTIEISSKIQKDITIITSPPYMKSLTYARDNRLRLWFLGCENWKELDKKISVGKSDFSKLMDNCFERWSRMQNSNKYCILVVGDIMYNHKLGISLPDIITEGALKQGYDVVDVIEYPINTNHKVEKKDSQIKMEKICVLRRR